MIAGVHRLVIEAAQRAASIETIAEKLGLPVIVVQAILASPLARAEVARGS